jgi:hypothetical protein
VGGELELPEKEAKAERALSEQMRKIIDHQK